MSKSKLAINEKSIRTELKGYEGKPFECLIEYVWNSFDAGASIVDLNFTVPPDGIGYVQNFEIVDNGKGWDFEDEAVTNNFISSTKSPVKNKTLPKGQYGRGRYAFIWIADSIEIESGLKKLTLRHSTELLKEDISKDISGTKIRFIGITEELSNILSLVENLEKHLILEFGWFLLQNPNLILSINGVAIDVESNIKDRIQMNKLDFSDEYQVYLNDNFLVDIVIWDDKPEEYSKFYFLNLDGVELRKNNTGLNKKKDNFWHSVYVKSNIYNSHADAEDDDSSQISLSFEDKKSKRVRKGVLEEVRERLTILRRPFLIEQSDKLLVDLKDEGLYPELPNFGIYDGESFDDLLKMVFTISPSLFIGKNNGEKRFICATFAGLLSNQDDTLISLLLEQLQELTEDEKHDLLGILKRSSLSNMIKTIKEVDHRLNVIDKLKVLITDHEKETLEVKHIQKILDENFWIFGEQFRLFSSTEGRLKNVLMDYAKEILEIEDPELQSEPNGEVDLFLTKSEATGEGIQRNIVVELKRASKKLTENTEYKQINDYRKKILEQNLCNGQNQYWEFYLIGKNYDQGLQELIDNAKQHGEQSRGLCLCINDGRVKIFVRKWSDILEVEWGAKMQYLKDKLKIKVEESKGTPQEITDDLTTKK